MQLKFFAFVAFTFLAGYSCKVRSAPVLETKPIKEQCNDFDTMQIDGTYLGANLYFVNPAVNCIDTTILFTTQKVIINDSIVFTNEKLNESAFEVPLKNIGYKMNTKIKMDIIYISGTRPRILHGTIH